MTVKKVRVLLIVGIWLSNILFAASNTEPLIDVRKANARIRVTSKHCYVRKTVAIHLDMVQKECEPLGLGLKIKSAYRPLSEQKKLWKKSHDNRYVADPKNGSRHNRGAAVDLCLVRLDDGKELAMPTTSFSRACHRNYEAMQSEEVKKNCKLLELVMEKHGFIPLLTEWWHFDYKDWADYSVLDIAISDLSQQESTDLLIEQQKLPIKKTVNKKKKHVTKKRKKKMHKKKLTIAQTYNKVQ